MRTSTLALLCGAAALALGALVVVSLLTGGRGETSTRAAPKNAFEGALMPPGARAPDFALRDQDGRMVRMTDFRGKPVIVTFLYSNCTGSCPAQAQQIKGALDDLGHDLPAVAVSVDPAYDSERQLEPVWKGFGIAPQRPGHEHQSWLTLVDSRGTQRVGYPGAEVTPERLAHDLRILERQ